MEKVSVTSFVDDPLPPSSVMFDFDFVVVRILFIRFKFDSDRARHADVTPDLDVVPRLHQLQADAIGTEKIN